MDYWAAGFTPQTWGIVVSGIAAVFFAVWSSADAAKKRLGEPAEVEARHQADTIKAEQRHAAVVELLEISNAAVQEQVDLRRQEAAARSEAEAASVRLRAIQAEANRRMAVLQQLREYYIVSRDGISNELMGRIAWPPDLWTNAELAKLGERWTVSTANKLLRTNPPPA